LHISGIVHLFTHNSKCCGYVEKNTQKQENEGVLYTKPEFYINSKKCLYLFAENNGNIIIYETANLSKGKDAKLRA